MIFRFSTHYIHVIISCGLTILIPKELTNRSSVSMEEHPDIIYMMCGISDPEDVNMADIRALSLSLGLCFPPGHDQNNGPVLIIGWRFSRVCVMLQLSNCSGQTWTEILLSWHVFKMVDCKKSTFLYSLICSKRIERLFAPANNSVFFNKWVPLWQNKNIDFCRRYSHQKQSMYM